MENNPKDKEKEEELIRLLEEAVATESTAKLPASLVIKAIFGLLLTILIRFVILYIVSVLGFGLFFRELIVENKYTVFLVALVLSLILTIVRFVITLSVENSLLPRVIATIVILIGALIANMYFYPVFRFTTVWVFYFCIVLGIFMYLEHKLLSR